MKIEYAVYKKGRIDLACFSKPFSETENECCLIFETKGFSKGLRYAPDQVLGYAEHFPECLKVVVANGYCYKIFEKTKGKFDSRKPSAYMNILNPRDKYPLDTSVEGFLRALDYLLPHNQSESD